MYYKDTNLNNFREEMIDKISEALDHLDENNYLRAGDYINELDKDIEFARIKYKSWLDLEDAFIKLYQKYFEVSTTPFKL